MQRTKSKILSILLSLVMLLSLLPTTALAASYPDAASVNIDGNKPFASPSMLHFKNGDPTGNFSGSATDYNAAYDPNTGTLTLQGYEGGSITLGGAAAYDLTIKLIGDNKITVNGYNGITTAGNGGNITITADSGSNGTLTIDVTAANGDAVGIDSYYGSGTSGDVTIKGDADVKINTKTKEVNRCGYGIYAKNVIIEGNAKVATTVNAPRNTGGGLVSGIFAKNNVTINTTGEITVDASNAGAMDEGRVYSTGVNSQNTLTLTKVGKMTVKWNDNFGNHGAPLYPSVEFDSNAYDNIVDKTTCTATYTPKVVPPAATITSVSATVSQPVKGQPLDTSVNVGGATTYTADVMWKADGGTATGNAQADTVYTALITPESERGRDFRNDIEQHNNTRRLYDPDAQLYRTAVDQGVR